MAQCIYVNVGSSQVPEIVPRMWQTLDKCLLMNE
jgi:hypothetical protein